MQIQTLNISLPRELVQLADSVAKKEYRSRSELLKEALREYLKDRLAWEEIFRFGQMAAKKAGIKNEAEVDKIVYEYRHGRKGN